MTKESQQEQDMKAGLAKSESRFWCKKLVSVTLYESGTEPLNQLKSASHCTLQERR